MHTDLLFKSHVLCTFGTQNGEMLYFICFGFIMVYVLIQYIVFWCRQRNAFQIEEAVTILSLADSNTD